MRSGTTPWHELKLLGYQQYRRQKTDLGTQLLAEFWRGGNIDFEPNPHKNTVEWVHKKTECLSLFCRKTLMNRINTGAWLIELLQFGPFTPTISCGRPSRLSLATPQPCLCQDDSVQTGDGTYLQDAENLCFICFCVQKIVFLQWAQKVKCSLCTPDHPPHCLKRFC